jgi:hypothetical protein
MPESRYLLGEVQPRKSAVQYQPVGRRAAQIGIGSAELPASTEATLTNSCAQPLPRHSNSLVRCFMTQIEIAQAVASSIGESLQEVRRLGFTIDDEIIVDYDSEPSPKTVDWDLFDSERLGLFP